MEVGAKLFYHCNVFTFAKERGILIFIAFKFINKIYNEFIVIFLQVREIWTPNNSENAIHTQYGCECFWRCLYCSGSIIVFVSGVTAPVDSMCQLCLICMHCIRIRIRVDSDFYRRWRNAFFHQLFFPPFTTHQISMETFSGKYPIIETLNISEREKTIPLL